MATSGTTIGEKPYTSYRLGRHLGTSGCNCHIYAFRQINLLAARDLVTSIINIDLEDLLLLIKDCARPGLAQ